MGFAMKQKVYYLEQEERKRLMKYLTEVLKKRNDVVFAYVYGSFAEGLPFHDIDVGVYVSEIKKEEATFYSLELAQRFSNELRIPIDVRVLNFAPVLFLYHVIQGNLISERNEEIRMHFVEQIVQRYLDLKPMVRRAVKEAFAA